jgi:hypothetical protein
MYDAMGLSGDRLDSQILCTSWKPFLTHIAKPFAAYPTVDAYDEHCKNLSTPQSS